MRRTTIALLSAAIVLATSGGANANQTGPLIQGRHNVLRAEMYAIAIDYQTPIQLKNRLCPRPGHEPGCEPVSNALRRAIEDAVVAPITWVTRERRHGGDFWALGPLVRDGSQASYRTAFEVNGCHGRGQVFFRRVDWTGWMSEGGTGQVTCSVRA